MLIGLLVFALFGLVFSSVLVQRQRKIIEELQKRENSFLIFLNFAKDLEFYDLIMNKMENYTEENNGNFNN